MPLGAGVGRGWLMKKRDPGEGWHLEAPGTDNEPLDPPLEDQGSVAGRLTTTIWKMRCQTTWPRDGNETSFTS